MVDKLLDYSELCYKILDANNTVSKMRTYLQIESRIQHVNNLEKQMLKRDFWNNQSIAKDVISQINYEKSYINPYNDLQNVLGDLRVLCNIYEDESTTSKQVVLEDISNNLEQLSKNIHVLQIRSLLNGKFDFCNAFVRLTAGAGGTEACDWAQMLYRMYCRYAKSMGFDVEEYDIHKDDIAGIKEVYFKVSGEYAYGLMKNEVGVHRLVRNSPFDANKRRHTSFAQVEVFAEMLDDIEVDIRDEDLKIDTYRSGGAGGQHINTTDSAVRIMHKPTGIVVACQSERSQHVNKEKAMSMLKAQLYEYYEKKKHEELDGFYGKKTDNSWGNQIRSYVLCPYTLVKDERTDFKTSNVSKVLDGDVQSFIEANLQKSVLDKHDDGKPHQSI